MSIQTKSKALESLRPGSEFVLYDDVIEWLDSNTTVPTADEIAAEETRLANLEPWNQLREKRNQLLAETDYFALYDVTMSDEMQTYRQALRDLPANTSDPANPTWPTKPGGS